MAFIRKRISPSLKRTPSYQVIETYREDGKVKQRVLANLGCNPTPEKALSEFRKELEVTKGLIEELRTELAGQLGSSGSRPFDRHLEKWCRAYARKQDTVQRLEAFVCSGKKCGSRARPLNPSHSDSSSFLDWVIDRNSTGWS